MQLPGIEPGTVMKQYFPLENQLHCYTQKKKKGNTFVVQMFSWLIVFWSYRPASASERIRTFASEIKPHALPTELRKHTLHERRGYRNKENWPPVTVYTK